MACTPLQLLLLKLQVLHLGPDIIVHEAYHCEGVFSYSAWQSCKHAECLHIAQGCSTSFHFSDADLASVCNMVAFASVLWQRHTVSHCLQKLEVFELYWLSQVNKNWLRRVVDIVSLLSGMHGALPTALTNSDNATEAD